MLVTTVTTHGTHEERRRRSNEPSPSRGSFERRSIPVTFAPGPTAPPLAAPRAPAATASHPANRGGPSSPFSVTDQARPTLATPSNFRLRPGGRCSRTSAVARSLFGRSSAPVGAAERRRIVLRKTRAGAVSSGGRRWQLRNMAIPIRFMAKVSPFGREAFAAPRLPEVARRDLRRRTRLVDANGNRLSLDG